MNAQMNWAKARQILKYYAKQLDGRVHFLPTENGPAREAQAYLDCLEGPEFKAKEREIAELKKLVEFHRDDNILSFELDAERARSEKLVEAANAIEPMAGFNLGPKYMVVETKKMLALASVLAHRKDGGKA